MGVGGAAREELAVVGLGRREPHPRRRDVVALHLQGEGKELSIRLNNKKWSIPHSNSNSKIHSIRGRKALFSAVFVVVVSDYRFCARGKQGEFSDGFLSESHSPMNMLIWRSLSPPLFSPLLLRSESTGLEVLGGQLPGLPDLDLGVGGRVGAAHLAAHTVHLPRHEVAPLAHNLRPHGRNCKNDYIGDFSL